MGIFNLSKVEATKQEEVKQEETQTQQEQVSQLQSGEIPASAIPEKKEETPKPVEIVLTGPLGHIYTQALNVLLAKEDATSMLKVYDEYEREEEDEEEEEGERSYVYVANGQHLSQAEVVDAYNDIVGFRNDHPNGKVIVGLESEKGFSNAANGFDRCLTEMGIRTYYKRKSITEAISGLYKK